MSKAGVLDVSGFKHPLKLGEIYVIGRKSSEYAHDIEIDDASVDIKHCFLDFTQKTPLLLDITSKCGTFVDGTRIAACKMIPLPKSTAVQFGNVEATLQMSIEGDSGFLEGRITPPAKDNSEIICNSPDNLSSSRNRARHMLKNTLTSTPNSKTTKNSSTQNTSKPVTECLVSKGIPRKSTGSNSSAKSVDSFYIPETQCPVENRGKPSKSGNASIQSNKSNEKIPDDDDFFIPETQDVAHAHSRPSTYPRFTFGNESVNETLADGDTIPSSQFRICTDDFNGGNSDQSNNSEDILVDVPCSMVIPAIRHDPVKIDDFLNFNNDENEIEKEMSTLQWSKKDDETTSSTINAAVGAPTPDVIDGEERNAISAYSTPDIFDIPERGKTTPLNKEADEDLGENNSLPELHQSIEPTQVFVKPMPVSKSKSKSSPLPSKKEKIAVQKDEGLFLPATQVFMPPSTKLKPPAPSLPSPPPPPQAFPVEDDLPATQVFQKPTNIAKDICLSSTLVDNGIHLSESSFKAKCNKLLDSDDDEMDEVVAPELVMKMRETLQISNGEKNPPKATPEPIKQTSEKKKPPPKKDDSKQKPVLSTPIRKTPAPSAKSSKSVVNIDNFLLTPDFLGKALPKDKQLQELAELNWNNMISEKQRKSLFGDEDSDGNPLPSDTDDSGDSFNDLLPRKMDQKEDSKLKLKTADQPIKEKCEKPHDELKDVGMRKTRSKSIALEEVTTKSKSKTESDKKPEKKSYSRKEKTSKKDESKVESLSKPKHGKQVKTDKALHDSGVKHEPQDDDKGKNRSTHHKENQDEESSKKENKPDDKRTNETETIKKAEKRKEITSRRKTRQSERELEKKLSESENSNHHNDSSKPESQKSSTLETDKPKDPKKKNKDTNKTDKQKGEPNKIDKHKDSEQKTENRKEPDKKTKDPPRNESKKTEKKGSKSNPIIEENKEKKELRSKRSGDKEQNTRTDNQKRRREHIYKEIAKPGKEEVLAQGSYKDLTTISEPAEMSSKKSSTNEKIDGHAIGKGDNVAPKADSSTKKHHKEENTVATICIDDDDSDDQAIKPPVQKASKTSSSTNDSSKNRENQTATSKPIKRKNEVEEPRIKRLRSANSTDNAFVDIGVNERFPRMQTPKIKIAQSSCNAKYQAVLERNSGSVWIYSSDPKDCDVLVVETLNRTYKLMVAIARGIPVVRLDWLIEVIGKKSLVVPDAHYIFVDMQFQERYRFDMKKTLHLAQTTSVFDGISFMMTPSIRPSPNEMKDIIVCAGGKVVEAIPKPKDGQRIYLISTLKDNGHWHRYRRSNPNIRIATSDGVMASVMQQSEDSLIKSIMH